MLLDDYNIDRRLKDYCFLVNKMIDLGEKNKKENKKNDMQLKV